MKEPIGTKELIQIGERYFKVTGIKQIVVKYSQATVQPFRIEFDYNSDYVSLYFIGEKERDRIYKKIKDALISNSTVID